MNTSIRAPTSSRRVLLNRDFYLYAVIGFDRVVRVSSCITFVYIKRKNSKRTRTVMITVEIVAAGDETAETSGLLCPQHYTCTYVKNRVTQALSLSALIRAWFVIL